MKFIYSRYMGEKTIYYLNEYMSLDTETSHNHDEKNPICWINTIQVRFNGKEMIFRKPSEFCQYLNKLIKTYDLGPQRRLMIIVHNLSYDFSYLIGFLQTQVAQADDYSMLNNRRFIKAYRQGGLDFRDTYSLTGKSLEKWGRDMNVEHQKSVGLYDYDKTIFQDTILESDELTYDLNDVRCLEEAFEKQLRLEGDTTCTIPYTSTGYNRRIFRKNAINNKPYMRSFRNNKLDDHHFVICVRATAGGFTHQNRYLKSEIVVGKIGHGDFRSHYPTEMMKRPHPFGKLIEVYNPIKYPRHRAEKWTIKEVIDMYPAYYPIVCIHLTKAILKDKNITMPFLQESKLYSNKDAKNYCISDNGRVLSFSGDANIYLDVLTLKIIYEQYNLKGVIVEIFAFETMQMPDCLAEVINMFYQGKSDEKIKLKEVEKEYGELSDEWFEQSAVLQHMKAGLNGTYGMFCQNPCHEDYELDFTKEDVSHIFDPCITQKSTQEQLDKYYSNKNSFLPYQVAGSITSHARYELYEYIKAIGYNKVLYCDTDSIFYLKDEETEKAIEELNRIHLEESEAMGAFIIDKSGKKIHYDVFEAEEDCIAFKGLHSKCYGVITEDTHGIHLKATIAGIPARTLIGKHEGKNIYLSREEELGGITKEMKLENPDISFDPFKALGNIKDNFKFLTNTGTCSHYITQHPHEVEVDGHIVETAGGCIIKQLESKYITDFDFHDFEIEEGGEFLE